MNSANNILPGSNHQNQTSIIKGQLALLANVQEQVAKGKLYRDVKWIWLLVQCAMPLLAVWYVLRYLAADPKSVYMLFPLSPDLHKLILGFSGGLYVVLWLIAESLLGMYRFPLKLSAALLTTGGFFLQFIMLALTGDSPFFAAFTGIYITMAAVFVSFVIMGFVLLTRETQILLRTSVVKLLKFWLFSLLATVAGLAPLIFLFSPLWSEYRNLSTFFKITNAVILASNTYGIVYQLKSLSIWGDPDPLHAQFDEEWKEWAPRTIILMILAVTAAFIAGGILGATGN